MRLGDPAGAEEPQAVGVRTASGRQQWLVAPSGQVRRRVAAHGAASAEEPHLLLATESPAHWVHEFVDEVPAEYEDAAMLDGYTRLQAFWRFTLPLLVPGIAATAGVAALAGLAAGWGGLRSGRRRRHKRTEAAKAKAAAG